MFFMYYYDLDGNGMEFQIDILNVDEVNVFMESEVFGVNFVGEMFELDEIVELFSVGKFIEDIVFWLDQDVFKGGVQLGLG